MKITLVLTLLTIIFSACNGQADKSSSEVKNQEMFYFLGKSTNNTSIYPNLNFEYTLIVIDMEDSTFTEIEDLKKQKKEVFCYISSGSWEDWRSDASDFPERIKGDPLDNWAGEKWLNISDSKTLELIKLRVDKAVIKGCNGVEFDNADGYTNTTGFSLNYEDQRIFNKSLGEYAKGKGLRTILKNDLNQLNDLEPFYDIAVNESCNEYSECDLYEDWISKGKYIYNIEYKNPLNSYPQSKYFKTYITDENLIGSLYIKLKN